MDSIDLSFVVDHWAFFVVALLLGTLGEIVKRAVRMLKPSKWLDLYNLTLPVHAAFIGGLLGLSGLPPCPESFCADTTSKVLYYVAAGMFSSYVYEGVRHMWRLKFGDPPPPPEEPTTL